MQQSVDCIPEECSPGDFYAEILLSRQIYWLNSRGSLTEIGCTFRLQIGD